MSTDRELLELAAKAAGFEFSDGRQLNPRNYIVRKLGGEWLGWNPLADDGDALRLAVKLGLVVDCSRPSAGLPYEQHAIWIDETMGTAELTRRAIVRAAAEIGRALA